MFSAGFHGNILLPGFPENGASEAWGLTRCWLNAVTFTAGFVIYGIEWGHTRIAVASMRPTEALASVKF